MQVKEKNPPHSMINIFHIDKLALGNCMSYWLGHNKFCFE